MRDPDNLTANQSAVVQAFKESGIEFDFERSAISGIDPVLFRNEAVPQGYLASSLEAALVKSDF
jgi:hypothetical protein